MEALSLLPSLDRFDSGCAVYLLRDGDHAAAVDLGDGQWIGSLAARAVTTLDHVFLTHHHADQCSAPDDWRSAPAARAAVVHAPAGEERFLDPVQAAAATAPGAHLDSGCPASYSIPPRGAPGASAGRVPVFDMAGFSDITWRGRRLRFLATPGHGPAACSVLADVDGRQVLFCGDALHAGGTIWQPWHLEGDHWTWSGALAAWEGIERLRGVQVDLLCPSHGPVISGARACRRALDLVSRRLLALARAKGSMAGPVRDGYVSPRETGDGWRQYSENLFQFGMNGWLLRSRFGEALVVDPTVPDLPALAALRAHCGGLRPTAITVSHCHADHCDGAPALRREGARLVLHPWVAEPLRDVRSTIAPWLPTEDLRADETWPETGTWQWNEYTFRVAPFPGQTVWHCAFGARVDGMIVAFVGDTFQPASRWNGTGGFCAYNRSLFREGFVRSARLMLDWQPQWLAAGHGTLSAFSYRRFRDVQRWARRTEAVIRALCPTGSLERDYYAWGTGGTRAPYRREARLARSLD
jgi:glyoxylase-like metal-dependent hydrolase (beta-lactamase superfamily II)